MRHADVIGLEARLDAQRQVLGFLLVQLGEADALALLDRFGARFPPADHQEDPGAVPTEGFAALMAFHRETEALLKPLRERLGP